MGEGATDVMIVSDVEARENSGGPLLMKESFWPLKPRT
jgi:hypothetical protein